MKFEQDEVELTGGVRHGLTLGGPVAIRIGNTEWPKWETVMSPDPVADDVLAAQARNAPLTRPDFNCCHDDGSSNEPSLGSTEAPSDQRFRGVDRQRQSVGYIAAVQLLIRRLA